MNKIKLLTNALKSNNSCLIRYSIQSRQQQLWLTKCAVYSTIVSIRNTGDLFTPKTNYYNRNSFKDNCMLLPQFQVNACAPILNTCQFGTKNAPDRANKSDTKAAAIAEVDLFGEASKLGLFAKFKLMYKKYWYVLIPVHVVTSVGWICGFYYLSKSGVDIASLLQHLNLSEAMIEKAKTSNLGHWAVAYLCYKVATPARYAVTLGGTTLSIKYLVQQGHIKPIPSKEELVQMYQKKKTQRVAFKALPQKGEQHPNK